MAVKNIQNVQEVQKNRRDLGRMMLGKRTTNYPHVVRIDVHHQGYKQILLSEAASWREGRKV